MTRPIADLLICGAGMAGVALAYELAVRRDLGRPRGGGRRIVLLDAGEPLALTSSRGTEAYRTWWPAPESWPWPDAMIRLMTRSVERLDDLAARDADRFGLTRSGYAFLTGQPERAERFQRSALRAEALGAGPLRRELNEIGVDPGAGSRPVNGADLLTGPEAIRRRVPGASPEAVALLHVRRAGWLDSGRLGRWLLAQAEASGVEVVRDRMTAVDTGGGRVRTVRTEGGRAFDVGDLVLAGGPGTAAAGRLLGLDLPLVNHPHGKLILDDRLGALARETPLVIWSDPVHLDWSAEERRRLAGDPETAYLLDELPAGVHARPRGEREVLVLWSYGGPAMALPGDRETWDRFPRFHPLFADVVLHGLARALPAFARYRELPPAELADLAAVDGGYYCKAPDNRPLIGPLPVAGAWTLSGLSGFGIMSSPAAADLLADDLTGETLPSWAAAFDPGRFDDPDYRRKLEEWDPTEGEL